MQTIASTARAKLATEVDRPNPRLGILVGHANLLDCLVEELVEGKRRQEISFKTAEGYVSAVHISWIDQIQEDHQSDYELDSDVSDEDADLVELMLQRSREQAYYRWRNEDKGIVGAKASALTA